MPAGSVEASMVRFLFSTNWPLVSRMVPPDSLLEKVMVSPAVELAMSWRNVPAPVSLALVTVSVAADAVPADAAIRSRANNQDSILVGEWGLSVFMTSYVEALLHTAWVNNNKVSGDDRVADSRRNRGRQRTGFRGRRGEVT